MKITFSIRFTPVERKFNITHIFSNKLFSPFSRRGEQARRKKSCARTEKYFIVSMAKAQFHICRIHDKSKRGPFFVSTASSDRFRLRFIPPIKVALERSRVTRKRGTDEKRKFWVGQKRCLLFLSFFSPTSFHVSL